MGVGNGKKGYSNELDCMRVLSMSKTVTWRDQNIPGMIELCNRCVITPIQIGAAEPDFQLEFEKSELT